ncbi:hypothetical protein [Streptomyces sp. ISL-94]|uniref:hypothetical protein n=1 Tax=Streptomyces sp. ISL-94 TaxID=2819190 RepID=UPI001BE4F576|nr:hypothetical protein [Streptomyces sp. ISL-94]MBT2478992.1 hypothetical protein [Streptomyces sp. ISL-94]
MRIDPYARTTRRRAWVGDLVKDEDGREAIVTDVAADTVWILRSVDTFLGDQWITTDPDSLLVLRSRAQRVTP